MCRVIKRHVVSSHVLLTTYSYHIILYSEVLFSVFLVVFSVSVYRVHPQCSSLASHTLTSVIIRVVYSCVSKQRIIYSSVFSLSGRHSLTCDSSQMPPTPSVVVVPASLVCEQQRNVFAVLAGEDLNKATVV